MPDLTDKDALIAFSRGEMTALDLRRRLGGASYGDLLLLLSEARLPLPRAPVAGREEQIAARARLDVPETCPVISSCSSSTPGR